MDYELSHQLNLVAKRFRSLRLWRGLSCIWIVAALLAAALLAWNRWGHPPVPRFEGWLLMVAASASLIWWALVQRYHKNSRAIARRIEANYPDLNSALLTAIDQRPDWQNGGYNFFQQKVIRDAATHAVVHRWFTMIPISRIAVSRLSTVLSGLLFALLFAGLQAVVPPQRAQARTLAFDEVVLDQEAEYQLEVEPGDTEVERGMSLLIRAKFQRSFPPAVQLVSITESGEEQRTEMAKSLQDPIFGARIYGIREPLTYWIQFGEQRSSTYRVNVYDPPECLQADANLTYPSFTKLEPKLVQDFRRLSAVEGTRSELTFQMNKAIEQATLVTKDGETIPLTASNAERTRFTTNFEFVETKRFELRLTDDEGRTNPFVPEYQFKVVPNRLPDLKLTQPARDVEVSPLEELLLQATAWDDFGLHRVGLSFNRPGEQPNEYVLGHDLPAKDRAAVEELLAFESLHAEPDQLYSYYFWAEDIGPDDKPRRVMSDMFFAEVRPFEEIFREGQQSPGGQQQQQQQGNQNTQQSEELLELQKQIINGTWKVIRRETRDTVTANFTPDVELLAESQQAALEQLEELIGNLQDAQSLEYAQAVKQFMEAATASLSTVATERKPAGLRQALGEEQGAYQALLKLRAREHEVVQSQQSQSQSSQSSRSNPNSRAQQQLQQLQLRNEENRYETENTQTPQEEQAAREDRQVLNRLKELAARQSDLNERIKELQAALEKAETPEERAEAERQLKRLQEEQERILRDTEELQERMQQPENQERMAEQQQQLDTVRENVRQSSEALREGQVSRASAEGQRAENELNELKEEFQDRSSGQFDEKMQQLREQGRELKKREQELAEQLENFGQQPDDSKPTLEATEDEGDLPQAIREQREAVDRLLEEVRETIEAAEENQPLLAEQLYDAVRETRKQQPAEALQLAEQAMRRGLIDQARRAEEVASEGIDKLTEGIEEAAESVLGDETDSLQRALSELQQLRRDLNQELARGQGRDPNEEANEQSNGGSPQQSPQGTQEGERQQASQNQDGQGSVNQESDPSGQQQREGTGGQPNATPEDEQRQENSQESDRGQSSQAERDNEENSQTPGESGALPRESEQDQQQNGEGQRSPQNRDAEEQPSENDDANPSRQQNGDANPSRQQNREGSAQQPGQQSSQNQNDSSQESEQQGSQQPPNNQSSQNPGQSQGNRPSEQRSQQQSRSESSQQQQPGQDGQPNQQGSPQSQQPSESPSNTTQLSGGPEQWNAGGGGMGVEEILRNVQQRREVAPLTGDNFMEWSDRLRDVEEIVSDPELRAEAARIRDQAKEIRRDYKRHSQPPNWDLVEEKIAVPLAELQDRVAEELLKRTSKNALVPIDRDPVPPRYQRQVRTYYERIGSGR